MQEVKITFRYTWNELPPFFFGGFELFFGGVMVGRRRKFIRPFREMMLADPGEYEVELVDWQGVFSIKTSTKFQVTIPDVERCQVDLTLEGSFIGNYFWLIPVIKVL